MLLETLTLNDVGTFRGRHAFDLAPAHKGGRTRPVVLFGGLNGAGKTTILNSIRLALYGRQSLDALVTNKGYEESLRGLIHVPLNQLVRSSQASVEIVFTYARLGERARYRVERSWEDTRTGITEWLHVYKDGANAPLLDGEAAQGFLAQLIPPGISQFFFFDGERIADLANDSSDEVLADAIRRLLGLDIADRLDSDLSVYLRGQRAEGMDSGSRQELRRLENEYKELAAQIQADERELTDGLMPEIDAARMEVEKAQALLVDQGGAWAVDRQALERELDELSEVRRAEEALVRDVLAGAAVFALAPGLVDKVVKTAQQEREEGDRIAVADFVRSQATTLKEQLKALAGSRTAQRELLACVDTWVAGFAGPSKKSVRKIVHGLARTDTEALTLLLSAQALSGVEELSRRVASIRQVQSREEDILDRLAHAPSEESIQRAFDHYQSATAKHAALDLKRKQHIANLRSRIWMAITLNRKMRRVEEQVHDAGSAGKAEQLAENVRHMIGVFKEEAAREKCLLLEQHLTKAFARLSRKEDVISGAKIDPTTFRVTLFNRSGVATPKDRLSAGEKQIFAIAMLEALGKTSGRNLPVIIDSPLGRLDSAHRANLLEAYFPQASHQVIVLSTDTEVDQRFYQGLRPHISHAYHLVFDEVEGCTQVSPGYFWRTQELAHAA
ncbi:DNA sulfur modification protein DndD [Rubrivivax gelatinosus]|uniref:DNA sulfur modification protein DndD n=1 Tax=Rubrivivax gelatinosus TaxID=28068 RepID=A0A4R2MUV8_RUBGE|nr:DNA sulfur modification protein DndD [Rubrivivax gelatinosus]TCP03383.1 DNA sulfur modification protein DndD [Rubrivivax gelatinosus]